jgi:hypothetical protein
MAAAIFIGSLSGGAGGPKNRCLGNITPHTFSFVHELSRLEERLAQPGQAALHLLRQLVMLLDLLLLPLLLLPTELLAEQLELVHTPTQTVENLLQLLVSAPLGTDMQACLGGVLHLLPPVAMVPGSSEELVQRLQQLEQAATSLTELVDARYLQLEERQRRAARQTVESLVRPDQPLEELLGLLARHPLEQQQQLAGGQTPQQALLQHLRD